MIKKYFVWWLDNMLLWVPTRVRGAAKEAPTLVLEPRNLYCLSACDGASGSVHAELKSRRECRDLGCFELDATGLQALGSAVPARACPSIVMLRLPAPWLLEREVVLPLAAEQELEKILYHEMDRYTPFTAADVFWTFMVERRDRARERLHLRLSMVTKAAVQPLLSALSQARAPTMLEVARPEGLPCRIGLQLSRTRQGRLDKYVTLAAAIGCALIAFASVALPFILQSQKLAWATAQVQALRPQFAEAETLERQLAVSNAGSDLITAEQVRAGDALTVLAAVTDRLPDDTWLTDFSLDQGKLQVNGKSAAAARLISGLSESKVIQNPEFSAPVTRLNDEQLDLFAIRAETVR